MTALPKDFTERIGRQLGDELPAFLRAMEEAAVRGIRMNPRKPFEGSEAYTAGERIPWEENGYLIPPDSDAGATIFHEAGAFYLQEPAAMLPARILDAKPGEWILDLCAAPGGKSTQIGASLRGEGLLIANEPIPKRAQILSRNLERMGVGNSIVTSGYPEALSGRWEGTFDGVLADAPCSGEGMFRRDPETRKEWSPDMAAGCAKRQREILQEAGRMVRPGGRLVYSTCTYNPAENEENVRWFLKTHPDFEAEDFRLNGAESTEGMLTCWPHRMRGEGQFAARLRRKGNGERPGRRGVFPAPGKAERQALREILPEGPEANGVFAGRLALIPECPEMSGIRILRAGLQLAEIRGRNAFPDHAAAMSAFPMNAAVTEIGDEDAARYMAGEEIPGETKGWTMIRYRGLILGWGKGSGGVIKNHYPKGLRKVLHPIEMR